MRLPGEPVRVNQPGSARRTDLRAELIRLANRRDVAALRAFAAAHPLYDRDLTAAVQHADDDSLLALLVTMASYARNR